MSKVNYFWISTLIIIVLSLMIWYLCSYKYDVNTKIKENFQLQNWIDTLKCLNLDDSDIFKLKDYIFKGDNLNDLCQKIIELKGISKDKISKCILGLDKSKMKDLSENFVPYDPYKL